MHWNHRNHDKNHRKNHSNTVADRNRQQVGGRQPVQSIVQSPCLAVRELQFGVSWIVEELGAERFSISQPPSWGIRFWLTGELTQVVGHV